MTGVERLACGFTMRVFLAASFVLDDMYCGSTTAGRGTGPHCSFPHSSCHCPSSKGYTVLNIMHVRLLDYFKLPLLSDHIDQCLLLFISYIDYLSSLFSKHYLVLFMYNCYFLHHLVHFIPCSPL